MHTKKVLLFLLYTHFVAALWPIPSDYKLGKSVLWIKPDVRIVYQGPLGVSHYSLDAMGCRSCKSKQTDRYYADLCVSVFQLS